MLRPCRFALSVAISLSVFSGAALADELTAAKRADIRKFIESTDGAGMVQGFSSMVAQGFYRTLKASKPDTPERAIGVIEREMKPYFQSKVNEKGGFIDQLVPNYAENFSHAEIKQLQVFVQSPVGKKFLETAPMLGQKNLQVRAQWGQALAKDINERIIAALKREKIDLPPEATTSAPAKPAAAKPVPPMAPAGK